MLPDIKEVLFLVLFGFVKQQKCFLINWSLFFWLPFYELLNEKKAGTDPLQCVTEGPDPRLQSVCSSGKSDSLQINTSGTRK